MKKIYFASDLHLGLPDYKQSRGREKLFVKWLETIRKDALEIFLVGDVFDFWWEYKRVVPRGYTRFLGKLSELTDSGIPIHFFTGNHDIWIFDYLPEETGVKLHRKPIVREFFDKKLFIAHGDGLGKGDHSYKLLKKIFTNKPLQWMFTRLHPNFALWLGNSWSVNSRAAKGITKEYLGPEKELLIQFAKEREKQEHFDYYVFGHRHLPLDLKVNESSRVIYLGDWIVNNTYGVLDENGFLLQKFS